MPSDKKRDFGRYLAEVVAKEIPVRFVSSVTVIFKSGKRARLTKEDLSHPLPLEKNLTWDKVEEGFENVQNVEIMEVFARIRVWFSLFTVKRYPLLAVFHPPN